MRESLAHHRQHRQIAVGKPGHHQHRGKADKEKGSRMMYRGITTALRRSVSALLAVKLAPKSVRPHEDPSDVSSTVERYQACPMIVVAPGMVRCAGCA